VLDGEGALEGLIGRTIEAAVRRGAELAEEASARPELNA